MDRLRLQRSSIRGSFKRSFKELQDELNREDEANNSTLKVLWKRTEDRFVQLGKIDDEIMREMHQKDVSQADMDEEFESTQEYRDKWNDLNCLVGEITKPYENGIICNGTNSSTSRIVTDGKSRYKLPKLKLVEFDGSPREWLNFWSQFKGIHEDGNLSEEEKFQYLIQATVNESVARQVVTSFPPTAENYSKAIEYIKSRFGKDKVLVEVYVRDLLKLVLTNTNEKHRMPMSTLYDQLETKLRALESLGVTKDKYASMLYPLVESALSEEILRTWERIRNQREVTTEGDEDQLNQLMQFLRGEVESDIRLKMAKRSLTADDDFPDYPPRKKIVIEQFTATDLLNQDKLIECLFCGNNHYSQDCIKAQKMSLKERFSKIREARKCFNCLKGNHIARTCRTTIKCPVCSNRHYKLMCNKDGKIIREINTFSAYGFNEIILQTLLIELEGQNLKLSVRALIDTGSERSYVTKQAVMKFGWKPIKVVEIAHCLFGGKVTNLNKHMVYDIDVSNINDSSIDKFQLLEVDKICGPISPIPNGPWIKELNDVGIILSDYGQENNQVHMLIGVDIASKLYTGKIYPTMSGPVAFETKMGWTLMGKYKEALFTNDNVLFCHSLHISDAKIQDLWNLDVIGIHDSTENKSREEMTRSALKHFKENVSRLKNGRYEVALPWIEGHPAVAVNYEVAVRRLQSSVIKLNKLNKMNEYQEIFNEWIKMGVIEKVRTEDYDDKNVSYLPHHPVFNPKSSTTPIRPVFDASTRSKGSPSLNDCLEKGPNLLELIPSILLRFRMKQYGVISDVKKAFLQISLKKENRNYLRFIWYENGQIQIYRHCRVVFGISSSPFLLATTSNHHLDGVRKDFEKTVQLLRSSIYVDNCVVAVDSLDELRTFIKESTILCLEAKFELRGWAWNGGELIVGDVSGVGSSECGLDTGNNNSQETSKVVSVLGLLWNIEKDSLLLDLRKLLNTEDEVITKRTILSATHKIFDPLGFISPVTIVPKMLLQEVVKKKLKWDEVVPTDIVKRFESWKKSVKILQQIEIPRWVMTTNSKNKSIHIFTDASKGAYAAVAFLRSENQTGVKVQMLMAKARVSTIKPISTSKLELIGCECGAKMVYNLQNTIDTADIKWYLWSDSSNGLSWIKRNENWHVFVYNRVKKIRELTNFEDWRHIPGNMNPADLPSRGCSAKQLRDSRWWEGPEWLKRSEINWPKSDINCDEDVVMSEKKKIVVSHVIQESETARYFYKFSEFRKVVRIIAWMKRWRHYKQNQVKGELTTEEEEEAQICLWRMVQSESFSSSDKVITQLNAFKDIHGLWRVKTKLIMRQDSEGFRLPILLPKQHIAVVRLIQREHRIMSHCGVQILRNALRERFWIIGARVTVPKETNQCGRCRRFTAKRLLAPEAPLPENRVGDAAVFEVIGIDLGGPLYLQDGEKSWFAVFTCAVYRAIHLELITTLSTMGFIQALRRFIARRGRPAIVYTDNGKNFEGTDNLMEKLDWEEIMASSTARRIKWIFNPPMAPWWGGWWERLVGMVKNLLRRNLGRARLDYEEMVTILCDCEQLINSRPLTYLTENPEELIALTPMMFLNDIRNSDVPDLDIIENINLEERYNYRQQIREHLRDRFRKEYLGQLVHRNARTYGGNNLRVGDVVLVEIENKKRIDWPIACITELFPGIDNVVRSVKLRVMKGEKVSTLTRPIQKLYLLEASLQELQDTEKIWEEGDNKLQKERINELEADVEAETEKMVGEMDKLEKEETVGKSITKEIVTRSGRKVRIPDRLHY